jgi:hypothetical protein
VALELPDAVPELELELPELDDELDVELDVELDDNDEIDPSVALPADDVVVDALPVPETSELDDVLDTSAALAPMPDDEADGNPCASSRVDDPPSSFSIGCPDWAGFEAASLEGIEMRPLVSPQAAPQTARTTSDMLSVHRI